ncbi:hypothetical protein B5S33_g4791 [[Candida] boidinii]|nr:hypothetical protein B5S27_g2504 [[Candida] boidinii]OWB68039.1 hypothetical protein B5S30_g3410 [[Candida] boidinii]OWB86109.1 hypothetical protein B5S33_g4791 [[Candida] boidinii]
MLKIKGLSEGKVDKIKEAAGKLMSTGFISATIQAEVRRRVNKITTGSKSFDSMLGGGISTMSLTEVFGEFRCGKTQLAHTLCYSGRGELNERQQKLNQHLSRLNRVAEEFNLAVFLTNQVQSDPGASALFASADGRKP